MYMHECVCVTTRRAACLHEQNGCIIGDVGDTVLSVGVFSACCPHLITGASAGRKGRRWGVCQLTTCPVCGTARQPGIPGVSLGKTRRLVISTNLNQKQEIVSCHTLFVISDSLPLLWPTPSNNTCTYTLCKRCINRVYAHQTGFCSLSLTQKSYYITNSLPTQYNNLHFLKSLTHKTNFYLKKSEAGSKHVPYLTRFDWLHCVTRVLRSLR